MRRLVLALAACAMLGSGAAFAKGSYPALFNYHDKYPWEKVKGYSLFQNQYLRNAVRAAVPNTTVYDLAIWEDGTAGPMQFDKGRTAILSSSCEPHNCGWHNWTFIYSSASRRATVCYHNEDYGSGSSWYADGVLYHRGSGSCPSEFSEVPAIALGKIAKAK